MKSLRCVLGWHKWRQIREGLSVDDQPVERICLRCGRLGYADQ